jgi:MHS family proline/betaine transporter-like MFS transporter
MTLIQGLFFSLISQWYDFAVFGYFSDVLSKVFFPPNQPGNAALIESFAVFGGAFFMRPVGGLFMGYLGDTYGRKFALEVSIFLMAFPTFLMGCLPTYSQVGALSYILLIIIRLLQGMSAGGQLMSSLVFTLEGKPKHQWGLYGAYVMATANFGTLLGAVAGYLIRSTFDDTQVLEYGWRIPFLSGILVSLSGVYLKYYCDEDDSFHGLTDPSTNDNETKPINPLHIAFRRENRRQLAAACFIPMLWSGGFYLSFVWVRVMFYVLSFA